MNYFDYYHKTKFIICIIILLCSSPFAHSQIKWVPIKGITNRGQIHHGTDIPFNFTNLNNLKINHIASSNEHTIAVLENYTLIAIGNNKFGQLGIGNNLDQIMPQQVVTDGVLKNKIIIQIATGGEHTHFLDSNGKVYGVGWNHYGQLGLGNNQNHIVPQEV